MVESFARCNSRKDAGAFTTGREQKFLGADGLNGVSFAVSQIAASPMLLTIDEAAAEAKVSPKTIERDIRAGKLSVVRIRGCVRIQREAWEEYLKQCRYVATGKDGKFDFSTQGGDLAALLLPVRTRSRLKHVSGSASTTLAQVVRLPTRSRKQFTAG